MKMRPDQRAVGTRLDLHRVADLAVDGADEEFQDGLGFRREQRQSARDGDGEQDEECHDRPGHDHRLGDARPVQCGSSAVVCSGEWFIAMLQSATPSEAGPPGMPRAPHSRAAKPSRASNVSTATATAIRPSCSAMALPAEPLVKSRVFHHSEAKCSTPDEETADQPDRRSDRPDRPSSLPQPLVMHPSPGRPEADRRPCHQQRSREKDAGSEDAIEPAAEEQAEQCRDNDRPAENADLPEPGAERGFGIGASLRPRARSRVRAARARRSKSGSLTVPPRAGIGAAGAGFGRR